MVKVMVRTMSFLVLSFLKRFVTRFPWKQTTIKQWIIFLRKGTLLTFCMLWLLPALKSWQKNKFVLGNFLVLQESCQPKHIKGKLGKIYGASAEMGKVHLGEGEYSCLCSSHPSFCTLLGFQVISAFTVKRKKKNHVPSMKVIGTKFTVGQNLILKDQLEAHMGYEGYYIA